MEKRKNPEKDIRKLSGLFFQIGLLAALMLAVSAFEFRSMVTYHPREVSEENIIEEPLMPITIHDPKPPPPAPKKKRMNPVPTPDPEPIPIPDVIEKEPVKDLKDFNPEITAVKLDDEEAPVYEGYVEEMPTPVGGYEAFYEYVSKNMKYPTPARRQGIDGKVFVQFIVDHNGDLIEVKAIKAAGFGLDEEAERVLKNAPRWNPGRQAGRRVKVRMIIPITFRLQ